MPEALDAESKAAVLLQCLSNRKFCFILEEYQTVEMSQCLFRKMDFPKSKALDGAFPMSVNHIPKKKARNENSGEKIEESQPPPR